MSGGISLTFRRYIVPSFSWSLFSDHVLLVECFYTWTLETTVVLILILSSHARLSFPNVSFLRVQLPFVGYGDLSAVIIKSYLFWDIALCSQMKFNRRFGGICRLYFQGRSWPRKQPASSRQEPEPYYSTLNTDEKCSSETTVDFRRTTRRYIPEDGTIFNLTFL
jgi:hypothetical protein